MKPPLASVATNQIPVVASTDDNYAIPLTVMFISLLENTTSPERIHLFVIDGGISESKHEKMREAVESRNSQLTFLEVNSEVYKDFPTRNHISAPAYYRISIPELFDESTKRCIYLDCDVIIKADITELWDMDLEGHAIAAVENISRSTFLASKLKQSDYFNSGVMLIDLEKWREQHIPEKVRSFKLEHPELISTNDQCALNGVFRGKWKRLPLHWNHQSGLYRHSDQVERLQQTGELEKALWHPSIIHFIGWSKPWIQPCYHPLEGEYRRYHQMSPFNDEPLQTIPESRKRRKFSLFKKQWRQRKWQKRYKKHGFALFA